MVYQGTSYLLTGLNCGPYNLLYYTIKSSRNLFIKVLLDLSSHGKVKYSKETLPLYAEVQPLFSVAPLLIFSPRMKFIS